jgi:hypothetical protein
MKNHRSKKYLIEKCWFMKVSYQMSVKWMMRKRNNSLSRLHFLFLNGSDLPNSSKFQLKRHRHNCSFRWNYASLKIRIWIELSRKSKALEPKLHDLALSMGWKQNFKFKRHNFAQTFIRQHTIDIKFCVGNSSSLTIWLGSGIAKLPIFSRNLQNSMSLS